MRLTFLGADHEVTGSCHFLQACGKNILIDCGMEQGNDVYENQELPVPASDVDYVLLTHAHIDLGTDTASVCERIPWKGLYDRADGAAVRDYVKRQRTHSDV